MKRTLIILFVTVLVSGVRAREIDTLRIETFMDWVRKYHPIAAQAEINLEMGTMEVRTARGGFDPLLYGSIDNKEYKESIYYDKREAGIKIPTWGGIELTGAYEQNSGQYLNPENNVAAKGLFAAGAAVNLGQGLILDERRAALKKALIYQQSSEAERIRLLNELYLSGFEVYWKWALAYSNMMVLSEGLKLTHIRYEGIKRSFVQGDFAAIDTVEAYSQLLNRQYRLQSAQNSFFKATQELNTYLWNEEGDPMQLNQQIIPQILVDDSTEEYINPEELRGVIANHPELLIADYELAGLAIEKKLKAQSVLPVIKLKYNFLLENMGGIRNAPFFENNYKWGMSVYTPLLWRKARGAVGLAKTKIDFKQNSRDLKELQLRTKLESEINNWHALNSQIDIFQKNVLTLERLMNGEMRKFQIGESSLFLVNAREVSVFDSRLLLNELLARQKVALAKIRFAAGMGF